MFTMKKIIAVLMSLVFIFAFAACSNQQSESNTPSQSNPQTHENTPAPVSYTHLTLPTIA